MDAKGVAEPEENDSEQCSICLQSFNQPTKLPCNHTFCFLCVKGLIRQNNNCALCRKPIPRDYLNKPTFVCQRTRVPNSYKWFYKGQSGWWQYDDRTNSEIESAYQSQQQICEVLIAGVLYVIDLSKNLQMQKYNSHRYRPIKRDLEETPKIGIAGIYGLQLDTDTSSKSDDACKASCSKNKDSCKSAESVDSNRSKDVIIVIPNNRVSEVHLNLGNNEALLPLAQNRQALSSSDRSGRPPSGEILDELSSSSTVDKHSNPVREELHISDATASNSRQSSSSRQIEAQANLDVEVKLELGHQAILRDKETKEGFTHDWTVFVRGVEGHDIHFFIEKVVFHLHETFPKPKRVVTKPPYSVSESGYAGFIMPIDIYFQCRKEPKKVNFNYDLQIKNSPISSIRIEKIVFKNPSSAFRNKLIKAKENEIQSASTVETEQNSTREELPISNTISSSSSSSLIGTQANLIDTNASTQSKGKKRKFTDVEEFTEQDISKSFAATILSKLQEMNKKQRLISEKLINDTLFKGLLGKLTENSYIADR